MADLNLGPVQLTGTGLWMPQGGMTSPYARSFIVAPEGRGDYGTIQAAIDAAVAAGASVTEPWVVQVVAGTYPEDVDVAVGVSLHGAGEGDTIIVPQTGPVVIRSGRTPSPVVVQNLTVEPATNTVSAGIELIINASTDRINLYNVRCTVRKDHLGATEAIRLGGTGGGFARGFGCYFYAQNHYTGANPTGVACCVVFHALPGSQGYFELFGGSHAKTSPGPTNTAWSILNWNEGVGTFSGMHAKIDWASIYATEPIQQLNSNSAVKGGMMDVSVNSSDVDARIKIVNPNINARRAFNSQILNNLDLMGELTVTGMGPMLLPPLRSGQYYTSPFGMRTTGTLTVDTALAGAFMVTRPSSFNRFAVEVTAPVAGCTILLGVYADDGMGRPGKRVAQVGSIDASTAGFKFVDAVLALPPGLYWLVAAAKGGTPTIYVLNGNASFIVPQTNGAGQRTGIAGTVAGASLPDPFVYTSTATNAACVFARAA